MRRLALLLAPALLLLGGAAPPRCPMEPPFVTVRLPAARPEWLPGQELKGACDDAPAGACARKPLGSLDVMSCPVGPEGSGRFWTVTIGIAGKQDPKASRGVCFLTSTSAWRILTVTSDGPTVLSPLRWLDDLDGDGKAEAIVWNSFPLREEGEYYESGLMAWVYQVDPAGALAIDWGLSRRMARQIASAYRSPPRGDPATVQSTLRVWGPLRQAALDALDAFAGQKCTAGGKSARPVR